MSTIDPAAPGENYSLLIIGVSNDDGDGGGVDGDGSGGNFLVGYQNRDFCPPELGFRVAAELWNFSWTEADYSVRFMSGGIL